MRKTLKNLLSLFAVFAFVFSIGSEAMAAKANEESVDYNPEWGADTETDDDDFEIEGTLVWGEDTIITEREG